MHKPRSNKEQNTTKGQGDLELKSTTSCLNFSLSDIEKNREHVYENVENKKKLKLGHVNMIKRWINIVSQLSI